MSGLADLVLRGDAGGLARALTLVENDPREGGLVLEALGSKVGRAHRVGVTGPPGVGKSTLVSALTAAWRKAGRRVGVLAVDPTSPFTGGALLGDRIRMAAHSGDAGVFIRSVASRGASGGLSAAVNDLADVLDAAGFDPVILETVGVGQGEVEVCRTADTTVLVLAPGSGDEIQGMKAGLLEAADLVVVNQADREGADRLEAALKGALDLKDGPRPEVLRTVATTGEGVEALRAAIEARAGSSSAEALAAKRLERARARIRDAVDRERATAWWASRGEALERAAREAAAGRGTPAAHAARLLGEGGR